MGNPFCHVELQTDDVDAAKKFYTDLLDWEIEDMPMGPMTYSMIKVGEGVGGGMLNQPAFGTSVLPIRMVAPSDFAFCSVASTSSTWM